MENLETSDLNYLSTSLQISKIKESLELVNNSIRTYLGRNFTNLSVSFGCTGGQHRSVFFAERLAKEISQNSDIDVVLNHLEQNK